MLVVIHLLFWCLRDMLLHAELLILPVFRFSAEVGHAGFLVFKALVRLPNALLGL
jgi:hypothetical protein